MLSINRKRGPWLVSAVVRDQGESRAMVIEIDSYELSVRQKGRRTRYTLPWGAIYTLAAQAAAEARKRAGKGK